MKLLDIVHPAAKLLVDISRSQDSEVGDGTTSVVIIAAGVPGIRSKVAEIKPPLIDPTYMATSRIMASAGLLIENVSGNVKVINMAPVSPGIAPTITPSTTPRTSSSIGVGVAK